MTSDARPFLPYAFLLLGSVCGRLCSLFLPSLHQIALTDDFQSYHGFPCWSHHPSLQLPPKDVPQGALEEADLKSMTMD